MKLLGENKQFIINPYDAYLGYWNIVIVLHLIYTAIWVPYRVCFVIEDVDFLWYYDLFVDICFCADIVITFFTGIKNRLDVITDRKLIAQRYIRRWFFIDLVTSVPFQIFER